MKKLKAFTLSELLVVLIIIGILLLIALPNLLPLLTKARSIEAQSNLEHIHQLQKIHHYEKTHYSSSLPDINFLVEASVLEGGNNFYEYEIINHSDNHFLARATAVKDFDGDGIFNVWEIDQGKQLKEVIKD